MTDQDYKVGMIGGDVGAFVLVLMGYDGDGFGSFIAWHMFSCRGGPCARPPLGTHEGCPYCSGAL